MKRRNHNRTWLRLAVISSAVLTATGQGPVVGGEPIQRLGRALGVGWGDGYHACADSGVRLGADLPPRSYSTIQHASRARHPIAGHHRSSATYYDCFDANQTSVCDATPCNPAGATDSIKTVIQGSQVIRAPASSDEVLAELNSIPRQWLPEKQYPVESQPAESVMPKFFGNSGDSDAPVPSYATFDNFTAAVAEAGKQENSEAPYTFNLPQPASETAKTEVAFAMPSIPFPALVPPAAEAEAPQIPVETQSPVPVADQVAVDQAFTAEAIEGQAIALPTIASPTIASPTIASPTIASPTIASPTIEAQLIEAREDRTAVDAIAESRTTRETAKPPSSNRYAAPRLNPMVARPHRMGSSTGTVPLSRVTARIASRSTETPDPGMVRSNPFTTRPTVELSARPSESSQGVIYQPDMQRGNSLP